MYWYKLKTISRAALTISVAGILLLPACKPEIKETGSAMPYFDLKGYFHTASAALARQNKQVLKMVMQNGVAETRKVHIANWENEFSLFIGSDINKPAWKDSYTVETTGDALIYKAKYPELETTEIVINKPHNKVKWILIFNHTKNMLYETKEKLTYFPDSMYMIEKVQRVKLLGSNRYDIKGLF